MFLTVVTVTALGMECLYFSVLLNYFWRKKIASENQKEIALDVSILKPLKGIGADLRENVKSFLRLESRGAVQIIFAIEDERDPVIPFLEKILQEESTAHEVVVLKGIPRRGKNPKNSNLLAARDLAKHPWIYISDADVRIPHNHLQLMSCQSNNDPNIFVTSMPLSRNLRGVFANVLGVGTNLDGVQYFALCQVMRRPLIYGGSNLFSRALDEKCRAMDSVADMITDDLALVNIFSKAKAQSRLTLEPIDVFVGETSFQDYSKTWTRWLTITRALAPEIFWPAPFSWSWQLFLGIGILTGSVLALKLSLALLLLRALRYFIILHSVAENSGQILRQLCALPLYDILTPYFWIRAAFASTLTFGGRLITINRKGEILS